MGLLPGIFFRLASTCCAICVATGMGVALLAARRNHLAGLWGGLLGDSGCQRLFGTLLDHCGFRGRHRFLRCGGRLGSDGAKRWSWGRRAWTGLAKPQRRDAMHRRPCQSKATGTHKHPRALRQRCLVTHRLTNQCLPRACPSADSVGLLWKLTQMHDGTPRHLRGRWLGGERRWRQSRERDGGRGQRPGRVEGAAGAGFGFVGDWTGGTGGLRNSRRLSSPSSRACSRWVIACVIRHRTNRPCGWRARDVADVVAQLKVERILTRTERGARSRFLAPKASRWLEASTFCCGPWNSHTSEPSGASARNSGPPGLHVFPIDEQMALRAGS